MKNDLQSLTMGNHRRGGLTGRWARCCVVSIRPRIGSVLEPDTGKLLFSIDIHISQAEEAKRAIEEEGISDQVASELSEALAAAQCHMV
jgi:hypothetical protein